MVISTNKKIPNLLIISVFNSVLTTDEINNLTRLENTSSKTKEQEDKLNELKQKKNNALTQDDTYIDIAISSFATLGNKISDFSKKVRNLEIIPIPLSDDYAPLVSKTNGASIEKNSSGRVAKGEGQDTVELSFAVPINSITIGLRFFYDNFIANQVSRYDKVVKFSYFSKRGDFITNAIVISNNDATPERSINKLEFNISAEIVREPQVLGVPTSPYELLGVGA